MGRKPGETSGGSETAKVLVACAASKQPEKERERERHLPITRRMVREAPGQGTI
jgi:hypothetical protein